MSDDDRQRERRFWLHEAIQRAKDSALPIFAEGLAVEMGSEVDDVVAAIEASLMTLTGNLTEESMRSALRIIAEPYAQSIGSTWEKVADAILGTLEWSVPDPSTWTLDGWDDGRKAVYRKVTGK